MKNIHEIMSLLENDSFWELCNTHSADPELLRKFTDKYDLPEDYLDLLNITDGFKLFHAGDYTMNDMAWTLEVAEKYHDGWCENVLEIGYFMDNVLLIDLNKTHTDQYLFVGPSCVTDGFVCVGTVTDFLNGLIENHGDVPHWMACGTGPYDFGEKEKRPLYP